MDQPLPQNLQVPVPTVQKMVASGEVCSKCKASIQSTDNFCPHCGQQIVRHVGILRQIWIYFVSIAFPPLGLIWTFRYFRSSYSQPKKVAWAAALLTVLSTVITIWVSVGIIQTVQTQIQTQLNGYQNLGL